MDISPLGNTPTSIPPHDDRGPAAEALAAARNNAAAPVQTAAAVEQPKMIPDLAQVTQAVKSINKSMASLSADLEFSLDDDTHRTVVKVIDRQTNEVIRQIPTEEVLQISKALDQVQGLLIRQKA